MPPPSGPADGDWSALFERARAAGSGVTVEDVRSALAERRGAEDPPPAPGGGDTDAAAEGPVDGAAGDRPDPGRVVADADVLAADLLVGGDSRVAMDLVRDHDALTLVAAGPLLDDAAAVVASTMGDEGLARDWRAAVAALATVVAVPAGNHPAFAAARATGAGHVLTLDESLTGVAAGLAVKRHVETSVKTPGAFAATVDPTKLEPAADRAVEE
ncbi:MAG: hypothetical protein ABEJ42_08310 [Halobacteriaceae archaeon]